MHFKNFRRRFQSIYKLELSFQNLGPNGELLRFLNEKWKLGSGFVLETSMQPKIFGYLQQLTADLLVANASITQGEMIKKQSEAIELLVYLKYEYIYGVADYYWGTEDAASNLTILDIIEADILTVIEDSLPIFVQYFTSNPVNNKKKALEAREVDGIYDKYKGNSANKCFLLFLQKAFCMREKHYKRAIRLCILEMKRG
jgi:hypothetical protein